MAFSANIAMSPEESTSIKQTEEERQKKEHDEIDEQTVPTELQIAPERIQEEIFTVEDINYNKEQVMSHIGIHKGTLEQSNFREWAKDTSLFLKDEIDCL